ncbi:MAG: hypothetical protein ACR2PG_06555 [Hyphomicrobiaceae bacterium]
MSTQFTALTGHVHDDSFVETGKTGFWGRLFEQLASAREREARQRVSQHLQSYSRDQLQAIGFVDAEIRSLRTTGILPKADAK